MKWPPELKYKKKEENPRHKVIKWRPVSDLSYLIGAN
jgi:hypothetical protein